MNRIRFTLGFAVLTAILFWGCASYKQNIMLRMPEDFKSAEVTKEIRQAERNYVIQKNDQLKLEVYSNKGERIIDPNPDLSNPTVNNYNKDNRPEVYYMVDLNGIAKFPVVGEMKMESLTLRQAESALQVEYEKFFKESFVVLTFMNKRVIVLGAPGGLVIPLHNQNVSLAEILAQAKGLGNDAIAKNVRIVRGDKIFLIDLSTVEGFQAGNMIIEPGDIIYVEPIRRPVAEALRDYAGVYSLLISTLSLIIVLTK
ncbi:MAG TPA: polysaccharide biosynthesis/export family protein [Cyclobacteriaceae bacterium]|nr:polysaccharide biosynthesis/export family protein [Cyclobacteriaceae bacterium]